MNTKRFFIHLAAASCLVVTCALPWNAEAQDELLTQPQAVAENENEDLSEPHEDLSVQMQAFFDGLLSAVTAVSGDCQAVSDTLDAYLREHESWIRGLDYATRDISTQTLDALHATARELGKKLASCGTHAPLEATLRRLAGLPQNPEVPDDTRGFGGTL